MFEKYLNVLKTNYHVYVCIFNKYSLQYQHNYLYFFFLYHIIYHTYYFLSLPFIFIFMFIFSHPILEWTHIITL